MSAADSNKKIYTQKDADDNMALYQETLERDALVTALADLENDLSDKREEFKGTMWEISFIKSAFIDILESDVAKTYEDAKKKYNLLVGAKNQMMAEKDAAYAAMVNDKDAAFAAMVRDNDAIIAQMNLDHEATVAQKDAALAAQQAAFVAKQAELDAEVEKAAKAEKDAAEALRIATLKTMYKNCKERNYALTVTEALNCLENTPVEDWGEPVAKYEADGGTGTLTAGIWRLDGYCNDGDWNSQVVAVNKAVGYYTTGDQRFIDYASTEYRPDKREDYSCGKNKKCQRTITYGKELENGGSGGIKALTPNVVPAKMSYKGDGKTCVSAVYKLKYSADE
jgi:hypothetical protein